MATASLAHQDTPSSAIAVVETFLRALERLDLQAVERLLADDVIYQNVPLPTDHGKSEAMATLRRFMRFGNHFEARIRNISERNGVVLTERIDVLGTKEAPIEFWVCGTFEVKNGKITLWRDYFDLATFAVRAAKVWPRLALYFLRTGRKAA